MNKHIKFHSAILIGAFLLMGGTLPVYAQTSNSTSTKAEKVEAALQSRIARINEHANKEIDRRIVALNALVVRIGEMKHLSDSDKSTLGASIQSEITTLNNLKAKIAADTDLETLRADVQSITKSYRVFALVIPRGHITAAADRSIDIAALLRGVAVKLQVRITEAATKGNDVSALNVALADVNAKITDATTKAQAAIAEVSPLVPDNGDKTKMQANTQALKDARTKVKASASDIKAAREGIKKIVSSLKRMKGGTASSTIAQ